MHELFRLDGFLNEIAKPGLALILQRAVGRMVNYDNHSKTWLIGVVMNMAEDVRAITLELATKFIDIFGLVPHMSKAAMVLVLRCFGNVNVSVDNSNLNELRVLVHRAVPITIHVKDPDGEYPLQIKRSMLLSSFFIEFFDLPFSPESIPETRVCSSASFSSPSQDKLCNKLPCQRTTHLPTASQVQHAPNSSSIIKLPPSLLDQVVANSDKTLESDAGVQVFSRGRIKTLSLLCPPPLRSDLCLV